MSATKTVTAVKCPCGHPACSTYGLSEGTFPQGTGWSKERAEEIALAINLFDEQKRREAVREEYRRTVVESSLYPRKEIEK